MRKEPHQPQPDFESIQAPKKTGQDAHGVAALIREAARALEEGDEKGALKSVSKGDEALEKAGPYLSEKLGKAQGLALDGIRLACLVRQGEFGRAEGVAAAWESDGQAYTPRLLAYAHALAGADRHDQACEAVSRGLALYPDSIPLHCHMAELLKVQGHILQAARALKKAIALDPGNPGLWADLAMTCLNRFDKEADHAAEKAVALAQASGRDISPLSRTKALTARARVASAQGRFEEAEALFHQILEQAPGFVPALQGLAQQYLIQGRIGQVLEIRKHIEKIDPLAAVLGLAGEIQADRAVLGELERAARIPSLEGRVRSGFLFALASAYEKRREYTKAFEFARQANEAGKRYRAYDAKAHRNRCFRIRQRFSRALFDHRRGCGLSTTLPVYVLGMPRSGTTLVEQILAGHTEIFGAGELGIIPQRIQGLNRWERHVGSGRSYPDCMDDLTPYISQGIAGGILNELTALAPGARHVVDKLPHNFENIGFIKFLFPEARIISLRRDPRDIAVSNYFTDYLARQGGMGFAYDLGEIGEQLADHDCLMRHWHTLFPGEILEIRYEDVVDNLEKNARKILDYIGVAWSPGSLRSTPWSGR